MIIVRKYINGKKVSDDTTSAEVETPVKKTESPKKTVRPPSIRKTVVKRSGGCGCGK